MDPSLGVLPARRGKLVGAVYRIATVCSGNICRSPTAAVVLATRIAAAGLADRVEVESFGLGGWHVGEPMDERSAATLTRAGCDATQHRARQFQQHLAGEFDLFLAADNSHRAGLRRLGVPAERIRLQRDFDPEEPGSEVPDPYYGGPQGFAEVLRMTERSSSQLLEQLRALVAEGS